MKYTNIRLSAVLTAVFLFAAFFQAQAQSVQWAFSAGNNGPDFMHDLCHDIEGNLYMGGQFTDSITLGGIQINNGTYGNAAVAKCDPFGNFQWIRALSGSSGNEVTCMGYDPAGAIIAGGKYWHTASIGPFTLGPFAVSSGRFDAFLMKIDTAGNVIWAKGFGARNDQDIRDIAVGNDGSIYAMGAFEDSIRFVDTTFYQLGTGSEDYFVAKFDSSGDLQWLDHYRGSPGVGVRDIELNGQQELYSQGTYDTDMTFAGGTLNSVQSQNRFVARYDTSGAVNWVREFRFGVIEQMAATNAGPVIIGRSGVQLEWQGSPVGPALSNDGFLMHISSAGQYVDMTQISNNNSVNFLRAWPDVFGNWYLYFPTSDSVYINGQFAASGPFGGTHLAVVKTDPWMNPLYEFDIVPATGGTVVMAVEPTTPGVAYVTLQHQSNVDVGGMQFTGTGGNIDFVVAKILERLNKVSGFVYRDMNSNAIYDAGDLPFAGGIVELRPGPLFAVTDSNGNYEVLADTGNQRIYARPPAYYTSVPDSYAVFFPDWGLCQDSLDFAWQPSQIGHDVAIYLTNLPPLRAGWQTRYQLDYHNFGSGPTGGYFEMTFDSLLHFVSATPTPISVTGNTIRWTYASLPPGASGSAMATFIVDTFSTAGTPVFNAAVIEPIAGDLAPANNQDSLWGIITSSYDPNAKEVAPARDLLPAEVSAGFDLEYTVFFQNTGNDTAFRVVILDSISPLLDLTTMQVLGYSHPMVFSIDSGFVARFTFDNILLPDSNINEPASHGFVKYRIRPQTSLADGDTIFNNAAIYFDFNAPVITNFAVTPIHQPLSIEPGVGTLAVAVYPNPFTGSLTIDAGKELHTKAALELLDIRGKRHFYRHFEQLQGRTILKTGDLPSGIYFLRFTADSGSSVFKLIHY